MHTAAGPFTKYTMKSAAILAAGIVAFALLAFLCLPQHAATPTLSAMPTPANFHARAEYGMLILRGSLPSETNKASIIQRAREIYGTTPGKIVDELAVDPRIESVAWADNISLVLPILGQMAERGSIIIDGRTIVVTGQVGGERDKAAVLRDLAPLTQAGLELEDRILTGPITAGRSTKPSSSKLLAQAGPASHKPSSPTAPVLAAGLPQKAVAQPTPLLKASVVKAPQPPPLPDPPTQVAIAPASIQKRLDEILARSSIEFESKSTTMTPASLVTLDQLIAELRQSPHAIIEIGGHTDKYGEPEYNLQLSRRRADAVRRYFTKHGLTNEFTAVGYGASRPLTVRENRAGLQRNRRIELVLKGQPEL
jgi:OOP family OmpA-OmpF porin